MADKRILMVSMGACGNAIATAFIDRMLAECGAGRSGWRDGAGGSGSA